MDEFVWLRNPETGGYFNCPAAAVDDWTANGWEVAEEPPPERNPVAAEHLAWREEQQDQAAVPAVEQTSKPTTKAARRGAQNGDMSDG